MSSPQDQAYINIERAYGEGKFSEALRQAEALLPLLPSDRADGLAERLQLLMGHIHLYGLGAPERAAGYYQTIHDTSADPAYRQLAQQGLGLCQNAPSPGPAATAEPIAAPATPWLEQRQELGASAEPFQPQNPDATTAASPWLEQSGQAPKAAAPAPTAKPSEASEPSEPADEPPAESPLAFDPAEEAELAKGLLKVVLR